MNDESLRMEDTERICCAPGIVWVQDTERILLVHAERKQVWPLTGLEAALWDWLALHYDHGAIVCFFSLILRTSQQDAERLLSATLHYWQETGIVSRVKGSPNGEPGGH